MNSLKNLKVVNLCWSCGKAHDDVQYDFKERDKTVKCECGGEVVTRSGKVQMAVVPAVPIWLVDDGETHRWAANTADEVREAQKELYGELDEDAVIMQLTSPEEFTRKFIRADEESRKHRSINEIVSETDTFPALISTSVW
jgi:hypothetical protein